MLLVSASVASAEPRGPSAADDGPAFLAWEAEHERLLTAVRTVADDDESDRLTEEAHAVCCHILTQPCRSRTAAVVKLRTVLHPVIGLFACGESAGDEPALQQVLAHLGGEA